MTHNNISDGAGKTGHMLRLALIADQAPKNMEMLNELTKPKIPPVVDEAGYYMKPLRHDGLLRPIMIQEDAGFYRDGDPEKPVEIWSFGSREVRDTITVTRRTEGNLAGYAEISGPVVDMIMAAPLSNKALWAHLKASGVRFTLDEGTKGLGDISIICLPDTVLDLLPYVASLYLGITTETLNAEMKP
jgi:hypothetical protein